MLVGGSRNLDMSMIEWIVGEMMQGWVDSG